MVTLDSLTRQQAVWVRAVRRSQSHTSLSATLTSGLSTQSSVSVRSMVRTQETGGSWSLVALALSREARLHCLFEDIWITA